MDTSCCQIGVTAGRFTNVAIGVKPKPEMVLMSPTSELGLPLPMSPSTIAKLLLKLSQICCVCWVVKTVSELAPKPTG